jgi:glycine betaine/choline ABC-type transport system substrate-binding protein
MIEFNLKCMQSPTHSGFDQQDSLIQELYSPSQTLSFSSPHDCLSRSRKKLIVLGGVLLSIITSLTGCVSSSPRIVLCSKNFTEQLILGELLAQTIEAQTDLQVERRFNLAGELCHQALVAGQVDLYVEYTGTAFTNILKQKPISDAKAVFNQVKSSYAQTYQVAWMPPLGFNNSFAMVVRGDDAKQFNWKTISDLEPKSPQIRFGCGYEFVEREDGLPGLTKTYNLKFSEPAKTMDLSLIYQALAEKQVDLVAGGTTDALIDVLGLVVLEDDKNYFPPYEAAPIVRQETLDRYPQLNSVLQQLGGTISASEMRQLNYEVDGKQRSYEEVVQEFLKANP